ncbi:MAG: hypothetical protein J7M03_04520 [Candidatus Desulfofervidaceae bacterium]|nr:hypothetical protein [Candidatus Desulfofervidaceae bacterium]MDL1969732.1 hypothetical protein [Candidatus Desulfofervidaceae bacterium]
MVKILSKGRTEYYRRTVSDVKNTFTNPSHLVEIGKNNLETPSTFYWTEKHQRAVEYLTNTQRLIKRAIDMQWYNHRRNNESGQK